MRSDLIQTPHRVPNANTCLLLLGLVIGGLGHDGAWIPQLGGLEIQVDDEHFVRGGRAERNPFK